MKNKTAINILRRLLCEIKAHNRISQRNNDYYNSMLYHTDDDYILYVEGVIEGIKYEDSRIKELMESEHRKEEERIANSFNGGAEELTKNEAIKREVTRELYE